MSAKPSKLPDPDLSPTGGETQDRRPVGLKKGTVTKKTQRAFDEIADRNEMEQAEGGTPSPGDTLIEPNPEPKTGIGEDVLNLRKPTYKYGDRLLKERGPIVIPNIGQNPRGLPSPPKYPASAKSKSAKKPDKHAYRVTYKT